MEPLTPVVWQGSKNAALEGSFDHASPSEPVGQVVGALPSSFLAPLGFVVVLAVEAIAR